MNITGVTNRIMRKVGIVGYGVVGKGMASIFKNKEVVVYDPSKGFDDKDELNSCELAIICVPTPQKEDGHADTSAVDEVLGWLTNPLILIKSTVPPTYTERKRDALNKSICFSPEYLGESRYYTAPWKYPDPSEPRTHDFMIIGGEESHAVAVWEFFKDEMGVDTRVAFCTSTEAELAKYMENTYFATKVTFCNEWADIAQTFGVEYDVLRELWLLDPRVERMHTAVFKNSRGYGGKCYPKDIAAIVSEAKDAGYEADLLGAVILKNQKYARSTSR